MTLTTKHQMRAIFFIFLFITTIAVAQESSMDPNHSILENTESSDNYKTLSAVMKASDLDVILNENGPFTVFAPSDLAFEKKITSSKMTELLKSENKKDLQDLMAYHIVAGNLTASKILQALCSGKGKASFTTVQGDEIMATMNGLDIVLTDGSGNTAKIVSADANQSNGVIHEIDGVILPKKI